MKKSLKIIFISIFAALTGIALVSCRHKNKDKAVNNQENTQQNNQDQKQDGKGNQTTPVEPTPQPQKDQNQQEQPQGDQAEKENGKENEKGKGSQASPVVPNPAPQDGNKEQSQADQAEKQNQPETKKEVTGIDISKMYYHKLWEIKFNELKEEILAHDITDFDKKYLFVLISKAIKNIKEEKQTFDQAYKEVYKQLVKKVAENSKKQNNELKKEKEELQADEASSEETTNNGKQTVPPSNSSEEPKLNGEHETTNQPGDADATVEQPHTGSTTDSSTSETSPTENTADNAESSPKEPSEEKQNDEAVDTPSNGESSTPSSDESPAPSNGESSTTSPSPSNTEVSTPAENAKEEEKYLLEAPIKENWDPQTGYITYTFTTSNEIYEYYKTKPLVLKITNPHFEVGNNLFEAAKFNVGNIETNLDPKKRNGGNVTFEISTQYYFRPDTAPESKYSLVGIYEKGKNDKNILKNQSKGVDIRFNN